MADALLWAEVSRLGGIRMQTVVAVGIGGFIGSVLRYLMAQVPIQEKTAFPFATLAVNVLGAFAIGIIAGLAERHEGINPNLLAFLRVGVCGGFTTFSTFALEIVGLSGDGRVWMGALYALLSLLLGVSAVVTGRILAA